MRNRIISLAIICLIGMVAVGRGKQSDIGAEDFLNRFMDATINNRHDKDYSYPSSKNNAAKASQNYIKSRTGVDVS